MAKEIESSSDGKTYIHSGHRKRLKDRFMSDGLDNFELHNVFELVLFYSVPRRDTNELAHALVNRFGSVEAVLDARPEALSEIDGIGENTVVLLKLFRAIARRYVQDKSNKCPGGFTSVDNIARYISAKFLGRDEECFYVMALNGKVEMLDELMIFGGSVNTIPIYGREIAQMLLKCNATSAIIAHNHPSGTALPSINDALATKAVVDIFSSISVNLLDHIIVAPDGDCVSLRESNEFKKIFES